MKKMPKATPYPEDQITAKLAEHGLEHWYLENGWIRRKFNTDGWPQTLMAVNAIAFVCEAAWHHADLDVTWARVIVKLKTHSDGGVTDKDFLVARQIENALLWRPSDASPLAGGNPEKFVFTKS